MGIKRISNKKPNSSPYRFVISKLGAILRRKDSKKKISIRLNPITNIVPEANILILPPPL